MGWRRSVVEENVRARGRGTRPRHLLEKCPRVLECGCWPGLGGEHLGPRRPHGPAALVPGPDSVRRDRELNTLWLVPLHRADAASTPRHAGAAFRCRCGCLDRQAVGVHVYLNQVGGARVSYFSACIAWTLCGGRPPAACPSTADKCGRRCRTLPRARLHLVGDLEAPLWPLRRMGALHIRQLLLSIGVFPRACVESGINGSPLVQGPVLCRLPPMLKQQHGVSYHEALPWANSLDHASNSFIARQALLHASIVGTVLAPTR
mmetsp:Transcript_123330/g.354348  ORF Transcript_123330/g.354348 Transcript_123330/m.354348 type:complete len:262 (+) Transcript_123330:1195-1980(+)